MKKLFVGNACENLFRQQALQSGWRSCRPTRRPKKGK